MTRLGCSFSGRAAGARRTSGRIFVVLALTSSASSAHFILQVPASWMSQDGSGNPQKLGPCGDEGGGTPTGTVTTFAPGETISITIKEAVFHPGHYRIALGVDSRDALPAEPVVTASSTPCGSVPIESSPTFPVLADGVLQHTAAFSGPQTVQVTLPANVTCTKCTLQVIEFMSNHPLNNPGGCFYHHCADIAIQPAGTGGVAGTGGATGTGGTQSRGSGGMMILTGGRNSAGTAGALINTGGGLATGGRSAMGIGGLSSSGAMATTTGGRSMMGSGGSPAAGGLTTSGGSQSSATGGVADLGGNGGTAQSDRTVSANGGTSHATSAINTAGNSVLSSTDGTNSPASGCACSVPGAPRKSPLLLGLALSLLATLTRRTRRH